VRIVLILLLLCTPALAHDPGHPELDEWFKRLKSGEGPCYSFAERFAVSDVDWESKDGHYRVRLENNWIDVPDDALITEPNRAGRTMVWPLRFDGQIFIRCFMPGSMGWGAGFRPASMDRSFTPPGFFTLAGANRPEASVQGPWTSWGLHARQGS
jgi:hypothetical protein